MRDHDALLAFLAEREAMPFDDGSNDCAKFCAAAVEVQTGRRLLRELGRRWSSKAAGERVLRDLGGIEAAVDRVLWRRRGEDGLDHPAMAQRGDIAGVPTPHGFLIMIVEGETLVSPGAGGLVRLGRRAMTVAWDIERKP